MTTIRAQMVRFGPFELDARAGELRRRDRRVRLQEQPLQVLLALLERPGELVTRDELHRRLWPAGTFVAYDDGLNAAVRRLRDALGDAADRPRYIETRARRGYRFIGAIDAASMDVTAVPRIRSVAVLPLEDLSSGSRDDLFADAMTDELITSLAKVSSLRVVSRGSVMQFKNARPSVPDIGRALGVDAIVEGTVVRADNRVRVTAQLVEAAADRHLWAESYEGDLRDVLALQRDVAVAIAGEIRASLAARRRAGAAVTAPVNPDAYFACIRGRAFWEQRSERALRSGIEAFTQAIEIDPGYGAAYAGLAGCYTALGYGSYLAPRVAFEHAAAAAGKALALDPSSPESEAALGYVALYFAWNFPEAERRFRRAIELDPSSVTALEWYSVYLTAMERFDDARRAIRRAQTLDPLSAAVATTVGFGAFYAGQYEEAIATLRGALAAAPTYPLAHLWLGRTYQQQGRHDDAIAEYRVTRSVLGDWPVALAAIGHAFGASGRRADAEDILTQLHAVAADRYVTEYGVALVHAGLGDVDGAFAWLDRAVQSRAHWLVWLKLDRRWNDISSDRRFAALLDRIGIKP